MPHYSDELGWCNLHSKPGNPRSCHDYEIEELEDNQKREDWEGEKAVADEQEEACSIKVRFIRKLFG